MPFTITIEKPTGEEAIAELIRVAKFYERFEGAAGVQTPDEGSAPAPATRKTRAKKEDTPAAEAPAPAPAPEPAPEPAPASEPAPAPAPAPAALDGEALRVKIRTVLTPLMKGEKAGAARALIKTYGDSITAIADDKLPALLAEAEAL